MQLVIALGVIQKKPALRPRKYEMICRGKIQLLFKLTSFSKMAICLYDIVDVEK